MTHDVGHLLDLRDGGLWLASCTCGWTSDAEPGPGHALNAWQRHRDNEGE